MVLPLEAIADADTKTVHVRVATMLATFDESAGAGDFPIFADRRCIGRKFEDGAVILLDSMIRSGPSSKSTPHSKACARSETEACRWSF